MYLCRGGGDRCGSQSFVHSPTRKVRNKTDQFRKMEHFNGGIVGESNWTICIQLCGSWA